MFPHLEHVVMLSLSLARQSASSPAKEGGCCRTKKAIRLAVFAPTPGSFRNRNVRRSKESGSDTGRNL